MLDCFAYIESYVVEEGSSLELKLEKKEAEITPEASPETTPEATPEVTPEADPETSPEVTPETTPEAEPEPTPETTPEAEPEPTPEADPETGVDEEAFWEAHNGLLPMAELAEQAEDQVYATVEKASTDRMAEGSAWTFDVYYVNQADDYYAEQFEDFNLKYQVEFHNSQDLEANAVEIRIPRKLFSDREGKEIVPTEIAVPEGTVEKPKPARTSPFNYYVDGEDLVFFNYEAIPSGSNAAFQVLYKKLILMDLVDETEWKLQPSIKVKVGGTTEERQTKALTGFLDSEVHLSSVTVTPYDDPNLNYTPGLYTKEQVQDYLEANPLPDKYEKNFDDYRYVVWQIDILGNANQAWSLYLKDMPAIQGSSTPGEIVGIARKNPYELGYTAELMTSGPYQGYYKLEEKVKSEEIRYTYNVVAAYPESACGTNTILTNTAEVKLVPFDGKDPDEMKSGKNQWAYADYRWIYVIGQEGNTNNVQLEYNNGPGTTTKADGNEVKVYSFGINVAKFTKDGGEKPLAGAEFKLYADAELKQELATAESDDQGHLQFDEQLDEGIYYLKETKSPAGYTLLTNPIKVEITAKEDQYGHATGEFTVKVNDQEITAATGDYTTHLDQAEGTVTVAVENHKGFTLPATGGTGIALFLLIGAAGILTVSAVLVKKSRKAAK